MLWENGKMFDSNSPEQKVNPDPVLVNVHRLMETSLFQNFPLSTHSSVMERQQTRFSYVFIQFCFVFVNYLYIFVIVSLLLVNPGSILLIWRRISNLTLICVSLLFLRLFRICRFQCYVQCYLQCRFQIIWMVWIFRRNF